jgi:hypothetical protein
MPLSSGSSANPASTRTARFEWDYILFLLLLALEFIIFDRLTAKNIAHFYPPWHDQIQYLSEVYNAFEAAKAHGFFAGLSYAVTKPSAQGMLGCPITFCLFEIFGPSRSAALAVNILFVIAFQAALFFTSHRVLGSRALAWGSFALTLCWHTVSAGGAGSASDFRLDLMAACAFGISLTVLLGTNGLRERRHAIYFGLSVAAAILVRFLTATYFVFIFVGLLIWSFRQTEAKRRISNLLLAGGIATLIVFPIFWINRQWIWDYYVVGHYFGPESSIRKSHLNTIGSFRYIGDMALDHAGPWIFILAVPFLGAAYLSGSGQLGDAAPKKPNRLYLGVLPETVCATRSQSPGGAGDASRCALRFSAIFRVWISRAGIVDSLSFGFDPAALGRRAWKKRGSPQNRTKKGRAKATRLAPPGILEIQAPH